MDRFRSPAFANRKVTTGSVDGRFAEVAEHLVIAICAPTHANASRGRNADLTDFRVEETNGGLKSSGTAPCNGSSFRFDFAAGSGIRVQTETSKMARFFQIVQDAVFPASKPCIRGRQRLKLTFPAGKPYGEAPASRLKKNPAYRSCTRRKIRP